MAYTAFEEMRLKNIDTYGIQTGPIQPYLTAAEGNGNDLKSAALRFIHNQCEKLNFDEIKNINFKKEKSQTMNVNDFIKANFVEGTKVET